MANPNQRKENKLGRYRRKSDSVAVEVSPIIDVETSASRFEHMMGCSPKEFYWRAFEPYEEGN